jgi:hypothetical protein
MYGVVYPLLSTLEKKEPKDQPLLFCTENNHDAVIMLKSKLAGRVRVIDCMVDRVCLGREIYPNHIEIIAEPYRGSIVILEPGLDASLVPFCKSVAIVPKSEAEASYYSKRKLTLVNGMHTTLAFLTLLKYRKKNKNVDHVLIKVADMSTDEAAIVEAFRTAHIGKLIDEFGIDRIMQWEHVHDPRAAWDALLDFSDNFLVARLAGVDDRVSRVLGGGVANRWMTRLRPVEQWFKGWNGQRQQR